jgi:hypothetical protein
MRAKQLSFLPRAEVQHGGAYRKGKRKLQRPFDRKRPLHLSLRAISASGERSLLHARNKWRVYGVLDKTSAKYGVRIYRYANVGNHLHLLVQAKSRAEFQAFLREFAGGVAALVTGAIKGRPEKFWDGLAWSTVVEWGRQFRNAARYVLLNVLEASGLRSRELLRRLEREGLIVIGPEPGS